ncbi:creatininase family protein, partial [bacterium]
GPEFSGIHDAEDFRRRYPDGRIGGDPALYSPDAGCQILDAAVEDTVEALEELRAEE